MNHPISLRRAGLAVVAAGLAAALVSCASPDASRPVLVGTTETIAALDPAATRDATTISFLHQLYPRLLELDAETGEFVPSLASTAEFTGDAEYTVTLPPGLTFANGDKLTASDVVFSFERQLAIQAASTSSSTSLLRGLASVAATDAETVVFTLRREDDATFPAVLAGPAGAILDEEVFSADAVTDDEVVVAGGGFAGPWQLASASNGVLTLVGSSDDPAAPSGPVISVETGLEAEPLATRLAESSVDAAFGSFTAEQSAELEKVSGVTARVQPVGSLRMLAFDFATMPYGADTEEDDPDAARAVRQAIADLVDRPALVATAPAQWSEAYGYLPEALRTPPLETSAEPGEQGVLAAYGDGLGGPDAERAAARLADEGVETPVPLTITVLPREGDVAGEAIRAELAEQLERDGLFRVTFDEVEGPVDRATLSERRYPIFEYQWTPAGVGVDDFLSRLYSDEIGLPIGIAEERTEELLAEQASTADPAERATIVGSLEDRLAARLPTLPLLSGVETLYLAPGVSPSVVAELGLGWFSGASAR